MRPDFFIVGAQKCGTTSLYRYLGQHPEVFMSAKPDPHFFGSDLTRADFYVKSEAEYLALFEGSEGALRRGEVSTLYLYSEKAAGEIQSWNPDARIIVLLRNPVDLMYSLYAENVFRGREDAATFERALAAEVRRSTGLGGPASQHPEPLMYRRTARFSEQIERYLAHFEPEQVHFVLLEDLRADAASVFRDTCTFLGIDASYAPDFERHNPNKTVRSSRIRRWLVRPPEVARRLARRVTTRRARREFFDFATRLNTRFSDRAPMEPGLRQALHEEFAGEIERTGALIGRDLRGIWGGAS